MINLKDLYKEAALELGLEEEDVKEAYNLYWRFFRSEIENLPLKDELTEEEFNSLKTSFNVPHIGKFYWTYDRYLRIKNKLKKSRDAKDFEV